MDIHELAVVSPEAELGSNVTVGPFAVIEPGTQIGDGCQLDASAQVRRGTTVGPRCKIGSGAILGADPQVVDFESATPTGLEIGADNVFREYVTVHRSMYEGERSKVGDGNYLMTGVHFGHDCIVSDDNTFANNVLLAGHVTFGSHAFVGGGSVFHQFVRVGDYVMCQGLSGFSLDLPHFVMGATINKVAGINAVGLKRAGFSPEERKEIKTLFRGLYHSEKLLSDAIEALADSVSTGPGEKFLAFFREKSKKGPCMGLRSD